MAVVCRASALTGWKRRSAKAWPKEYLELVFGHEKDGIRYVERFVQIPQGATKYTVWPKFTTETYQDFIAEQESKLGLDYLGSIHTHTVDNDLCLNPSLTDNIGCLECEEQIFAIDMLLKKKGRYRHHVLWFEPQAPLDVVLV
jgi:hypothetical protein